MVTRQHQPAGRILDEWSFFRCLIGQPAVMSLPVLACSGYVSPGLTFSLFLHQSCFINIISAMVDLPLK